MNIKVLVNGSPGTGKSFFGLTFPRVAWLITEPGNEILLETHPELAKNVVWHESFIPSPLENVKSVFERLDKAIDKAHKEGVDGTVETLFLDNISYLFENRWLYINQHEKILTGSGALDTRGMYGTLGRWGYQFTLIKLLSFTKNVVVSCHEMVEGDEAMGSKVDKSTPIVPNIIGGFREKISGMFSAAIYLDKKRVGENKYQYVARCQRGNQRDAKNRLGLPEIVENISYQAMLNAVNSGKQTK